MVKLDSWTLTRANATLAELTAEAEAAGKTELVLVSEASGVRDSSSAAERLAYWVSIGNLASPASIASFLQVELGIPVTCVIDAADAQLRSGRPDCDMTLRRAQLAVLARRRAL
jgi:hypothetical protein